MTSSVRPLRSAWFLMTLLTFVLLLAGCAGGPEAAPDKPTVSCHLLSRPEIWNYGSTNESNPFIAPLGLVHGTPDEFVVLGLDLSLPEAARVGITGSTQDSAGNPVARPYDLKEMQAYWGSWGDKSERSFRSLLDTLVRWSVPSLEFTAHRGRSRYVIVLMGKNPIPRPASVMVSISLNAVEAGSFTFPLPPKK